MALCLRCKNDEPLFSMASDTLCTTCSDSMAHDIARPHLAQRQLTEARIRYRRTHTFEPPDLVLPDPVAAEIGPPTKQTNHKRTL